MAAGAHHHNETARRHANCDGVHHWLHYKNILIPHNGVPGTGLGQTSPIRPAIEDTSSRMADRGRQLSELIYADNRSSMQFPWRTSPYFHARPGTDSHL